MRRIELGWREEGGLEQLAEELAGAARESLGEVGNEEAGGGGGASLLSTGENPLLGFLRGENSGLQLAALLAALLFGAGHALTPGHGKTLVASYLVGSRGTLGQAVVLGLVVTFAHTFSVFVLGTVALLLSDVLAPEALFPWIELASGLLILLIGGALLRERVGAWRSVRVRREAPGFHHAGHWHPPGTPPHEHGPDWTSEGRGRLRWGRLLALGLGGGILPCPSAMVVLLAAIAFHRLLWGMVLVLAFSAGMSAVLVLLGCLVVLLGSRFNRFSPSRELVLLVSIAGACLVLLLGALIAWGGLSRAIEPELPSVPGDAALLLLGGTPSPPVEPA